MIQSCVKSPWILIALFIFVSGCSSLGKQDRTTIIEEQAAAEASQRQAEFAQALALLESKDFDSAYLAFESFIQDHPAYSSPWVNLAFIDMERQDKNLAKQHLQKALELNPRNKQAYNMLGVLSRQSGQFEQARMYYQKAIEVDPAYAEAVLNEAMLLDMYMGQHSEALKQYELYQSLLVEPDEQVSEWVYDLKNR